MRYGCKRTRKNEADHTSCESPSVSVALRNRVQNIRSLLNHHTEDRCCTALYIDSSGRLANAVPMGSGSNDEQATKVDHRAIKV